MTAFFSQKIEILYGGLKKLLFAPGLPPLSHRLVIVPSPLMRQWLTIQLAEDPDIGIAMGIEIVTHDPLVCSAISRLDLKIGLYEKLQDMGRALEMASLFSQYALHAPGFVPEGEQRELWLACFPEAPQFSLPSQPDQIHLFGWSFFPPAHYRHFAQSGIPFYDWVLSPCFHFWSDLISDKQSSALALHWQKRGVRSSQLIALEEYLRERHPLLANFGRLGRERADLVDDMMDEAVELYGEEKEGTLLSHIRRELVELSPATPLDGDDSLELHATAHRLREVEVVGERLMRLMTTYQIAPHQVVVMAPDMRLYEPYLKALWRDVAIQVIDTGQALEKPIFKAFLQILQLGEGRWEAPAVMALLENPHFAEKRKWGAEALQTIRRWMEAAKIRWGLDAVHRAQFVEAPAPSSLGTWQEGWELLLRGLADEDYPFVSFSEAPLLGEWIETMHKLRFDPRLRSMQDWKLLFLEIGDTFFAEGFEKETLIGFIQRLDSTQVTLLPLQAVLLMLEDLLSKREFSFGESHLGAMKCCSMQPMRAIPAEIVVLMGVGVEEFPRVRRHNPRNQLPSSVYCPTSTDFDRFLFLEALLSARSHLLISWHGEDPSLVVQELIKTYALKPHSHCFESPLQYARPKPASFSPVSVVPTQWKVRQMESVYRHPLRAFLRTHYRVRLEDLAPFASDEAFEAEEPYLLQDLWLEKGAEHAWEKAHQKRLLPEGLFGQKTWADIENKLDHYFPHSHLRIELDPHTEIPLQIAPQQWKVPVLNWEGVELTGSFYPGSKSPVAESLYHHLNQHWKLWQEPIPEAPPWENLFPFLIKLYQEGPPLHQKCYEAVREGDIDAYEKWFSQQEDPYLDFIYAEKPENTWVKEWQSTVRRGHGDI